MADKKINFKEKIFNVRKETAPISKDIANNFFKSKYFDVNKLLEAIDESLINNRILLTQPIIDNKVYSILEDLDSDEKRESFLELKHDTKAQDKGSEITYYRRYTLQSLLGLIAEDDDGNKASQSKQVNQTNDKPFLNIKEQQGQFTANWQNVCKGIQNKSIKSLNEVKAEYKVSKETETALLKAFEKYQKI